MKFPVYPEPSVFSSQKYFWQRSSGTNESSYPCLFQFSEPPVNIVDSSTFVRQKTKAQGGTDGGDDVIGNVEEEEEEETDIAVMDYEQLMSYFESLKESSAWWS